MAGGMDWGVGRDGADAGGRYDEHKGAKFKSKGQGYRQVIARTVLANTTTFLTVTRKMHRCSGVSGKSAKRSQPDPTKPHHTSNSEYLGIFFGLGRKPRLH